MRIPYSILLILIFFFTSQRVFSQKMFLSDMTGQDKDTALLIVERFITALSTGDKTELLSIVNTKSVFIGNGQWYDGEQLFDALNQMSSDLDFTGSIPRAYTFDEFLDNHTSNALVSRTYMVFDNHSVLIHTNYTIRDDVRDCIFVLRKNKSTDWSIRGIEGIFPVDPDTAGLDKKLFREERISSADISIPMPREFSGPDEISGQTIFYFEGQSGRDAVFQVIMDDLKAKIYYYTFKFIEHNNQQFRMSNMIVEYLPTGIKYEYEVIDPEGTKNKGITVGIERSGKVIIIQFYSLFKAYGQIRPKIDYALENITLK